MATLTFIPNAVNKNGTGGMSLGLDDISDEVKKDVEEVYKALKTNPGRVRVQFDSIAELNSYIAQMKAYCEQRPGGAIRFRKSPARDLPATAMDFRITDIPKEELQTQEIRNSVQDVKNSIK